MRYCLDANILIDVFRGDSALGAKIEGINPGQICITPIALAELYEGAYRSKRQSEALALIDDFTLNTEILDFSDDACRIFGQRYAELTKRGKITQEPDLMIAAIALAHNAALITRNVKDFENITGLKVLKW
jgi:tRNA(fMet)-specific endonuclease VapC